MSRPRATRSAGVISEDRLALIPQRHWITHEFCFFLHDQMLWLLSQYEDSGVHRSVERAFFEVVQGLPPEDRELDLISILRKDTTSVAYRHHLVSHAVFALTSDMLHFLYEALSCFEKRKFTVAFSLLRKPLKENLLFLSWLLGDEANFLKRFDENPHEALNGVSPEARVTILGAAIARLPVKEAFSAELLHDIIYSKSSARGFEPVWQRASHLVTSQGRLLRTQPLDLNLLFVDSRDDGLLDHAYAFLPYVMVYAVQVALECFGRIVRYNDLTVSHLLLVTLGCYESLFPSQKRNGVTQALRQSLRDFLNCPHCSARYRLTRERAARMFLSEQIECSKCGLDSPFPLYWLLTVSKMRVTRDQEGGPSLLDEHLRTVREEG